MAGPIFLITGTPGAGKSSVSKGLMQRFTFGIHLPVDDLRELVVSGIAHPVPEWTAETGRQFGLARQAAVAMAKLYAEAGFAVAIDDIIYPEDAQKEFIEPLQGYDVYKVLLQPGSDTALQRNISRTNKAFDTTILNAVIFSIHNALADRDFTGWLVIDNSQLTLEETVSYIYQAGKFE